VPSRLQDQRRVRKSHVTRCRFAAPGATHSISSRGLTAIELNASQGNTLIVLDEDRIVSVGNFDVLPLAAAVDFVRLALAPVLTAGNNS
jgi:histidine ammonia-lyase